MTKPSTPLAVPFATDYGTSEEESKKLKTIWRPDLKLMQSAIDGKDWDLAQHALNLLKMGMVKRQEAETQITGRKDQR